jgi:ankyrin repeat protein
VRLLLARKEIQINQAANDGQTPLGVACCYGRVDVVKLLLARPEILINKAKNNGSTPLYGACYWGKVEVVRLLLTNKDIDINQAGPYQFWYNNREMHGTPLKIAQLHLRNHLGEEEELDHFRKIIALFKNK